MRTYVKEVDGRRVIKPANKIVIIKDDMQTISPTHDMIIADGWEEYVAEVIELPKEKTLEDVKSEMIEQILAYDSSEEVNSFFVRGYKMWLDKATRVGLMLRVDSELDNGMTETTLWFNGIPFTLNLDEARKMLQKIELYASRCYDNTQRHIANINALDSIEEVESYDYKSEYPEKLEF